MGLELRAFLVLLLLSLAVPFVLFLPLRTSLRQVLQQAVKTDAGVTFYLRSFLLVLFLSALSAAIGTSFDFPLSIAHPLNEFSFVRPELRLRHVRRRQQIVVLIIAVRNRPPQGTSSRKFDSPVVKKFQQWSERVG